MKPVINSTVSLLQQLISIPSFSKEENKTADAIERFLAGSGPEPRRFLNNVWAVNKHFTPGKFTLLLNSHHDTVRPGTSYSKDPFTPQIADGKLFGLGSNDAGGCLVTLLQVFLFFYEQELPFNLVFAASAEEEISGKNGIEALLPQLPAIDVAIVGEPTKMNMAVAERGLMVLDVLVTGKTGHAARNEGENAIYKAIRDMEWFQKYEFQYVSSYLGKVNMAVTSVETPNKAHNVVPDTCSFIVDVRMNERYTHEQILEIVSSHISGKATPRSTRLKPSFIEERHPLVMAGKKLGLSSYGSPTSSDMALMPFPSLKIGPGDSARSHTPDEYIYLHELESGFTTYISLLENFRELIKEQS